MPSTLSDCPLLQIVKMQPGFFFIILNLKIFLKSSYKHKIDHNVCNMQMFTLLTLITLLLDVPARRLIFHGSCVKCFIFKNFNVNFDFF